MELHAKDLLLEEERSFKTKAQKEFVDALESRKLLQKDFTVRLNASASRCSFENNSSMLRKSYFTCNLNAYMFSYTRRM